MLTYYWFFISLRAHEENSLNYLDDIALQSQTPYPSFIVSYYNEEYLLLFFGVYPAPYPFPFTPNNAFIFLISSHCNCTAPKWCFLFLSSIFFMIPVLTCVEIFDLLLYMSLYILSCRKKVISSRQIASAPVIKFA